MSIDEPRWLPVVDFEGLYEVSEDGRVRPLRQRNNRWPAGRELKPSITPKGYSRITLTHYDYQLHAFAHRLVAAAFIGPLPEGQYVRHLDGNPGNNHFSNLAYGTISENSQDSIRHGTQYPKRLTHCANGHAYAEHAYTPANNPTRRICRPCRNASHRAYRLRQKGGAA